MAFARPPSPERVEGLLAAECFTTMDLGVPVVSPRRARPTRLAVFAAWDDKDALDRFLSSKGLGSTLADAWHVRLEFLRRWGSIAAFDELTNEERQHSVDEPVVAVTLARMKLPQLPRFIRWGRPVESLVRDDPATTMALAAVRAPRTVSTFSIWETAEDMSAMVRGHAAGPDPSRHIDAMRERDRKDFHFEFTTLRFRSLSEHGEWDGRDDWVPRS